MWAKSKTVFLFLVVNILVVTTISITWSFISAALGLQNDYYTYILGFSLILGMGGAFFSLFASKFMAKTMMGVQVVDPHVSDVRLQGLVQSVHNLAKGAGLPKMPEVGVYDSPEVNAFATGPSKSNSLVAVSTGLLHKMDRDELEGVLAHEVAHIANGDMVTMTLIQGVINAVVMFAARALANVVAGQMDRDAGPWVHFGLVFLFQIAFGILGAVVVNYFSRHREYRADRGGAQLAGTDKMVSALRSLMDTQTLIEPDQQAIASLKISGRSRSALAFLFSTHPPLEERIARLQQYR
ncbi:MAG: protease HtpX [Pseudobdellovibrionaceae bacterium]|nr:protease HtpX [Bdellovibrionales bacterium]USN47615.1 MAG: protease HtpX [Pseudobdellovibrionaceae bacterium]